MFSQLYRALACPLGPKEPLQWIYTSVETLPVSPCKYLICFSIQEPIDSFLFYKLLHWHLVLFSPQIQFCLTMLQTALAVVWPCGFPMGWLYFQISYMLSFTVLFSNFYIQVRSVFPFSATIEKIHTFPALMH